MEPEKEVKLINTHFYNDLDISELDSRLTLEELESRLELTVPLNGTCAVHCHGNGVCEWCVSHCTTNCNNAPW